MTTLAAMRTALPVLAVSVGCRAPAPKPARPAVTSNEVVSVPILPACGSAYRLTEDDETLQRPGPHGVGYFSCGWPDAASEAGIRTARVAFRVCVDMKGRPRGMVVLDDPGFGFIDTVSECLGWVTFSPGRDARGRPISAVSPPIHITFRR
jgi:hypothetical protein